MNHPELIRTVEWKDLRKLSESPLGIIGEIFNKIFLENYLKNFLLERNNLIKAKAEFTTKLSHEVAI